MGASYQPLQLGDELGISPQGELGVDQLLDGGQPELLEARDLRLREGLEGEVGEWLPAEERQRLAERKGRICRREVACCGHEALEMENVELLGSQLDPVPGRAREDRLFSQPLPQPRHVDLHGLRRARRGLARPELVDQPIGGDDLVRVEKQERKERALLAVAQHDRLAMLDDLERSEQPELRHSADATTGLDTANSAVYPPVGTSGAALQPPPASLR